MLARLACLLGRHAWIEDPYSRRLYCADCYKPRRTHH